MTNVRTRKPVLHWLSTISALIGIGALARIEWDGAEHAEQEPELIAIEGRIKTFGLNDTGTTRVITVETPGGDTYIVPVDAICAIETLVGGVSAQ